MMILYSFTPRLLALFLSETDSLTPGVVALHNTIQSMYGSRRSLKLPVWQWPVLGEGLIQMCCPYTPV